jgi:hypothetical protein
MAPLSPTRWPTSRSGAVNPALAHPGSGACSGSVHVKGAFTVLVEDVGGCGDTPHPADDEQRCHATPQRTHPAPESKGPSLPPLKPASVTVRRHARGGLRRFEVCRRIDSWGRRLQAAGRLGLLLVGSATPPPEACLPYGHLQPFASKRDNELQFRRPLWTRSEAQPVVVRVATDVNPAFTGVVSKVGDDDGSRSWSSRL